MPGPEVIERIVWLVLLFLFLAGEAATVGLTCIWFAAGALIALICALLGGSVWLQIGAFVVVSLLCLLAVRPLAQRMLNSKVQPTNADRVIGAEARVTEDIDNIQGTGAVRVGGVIWTARSTNNSLIPAGTLVRVLRIEGVKLYVEEVRQPAGVAER